MLSHGIPLAAQPLLKFTNGQSGFTHLTITAYLETGGSWGLSPERLRAYVLEHYTWERHVDAVEAVAREMTQSRRGSRS